MGRGRGKGKKQTILATREDGSGEEEKMPVKRRGRPTKALKDEIEEEEEVEKMEDEEDGGDTKSSISKSAVENGKKRKRPSQVKEGQDSMKEENGNGVGVKTSGNDATKPVVGFRQNGSRRKNKPRRAAEVGVEAT